jgi:putative SOS response-associated peptidase YedK
MCGRFTLRQRPTVMIRQLGIDLQLTPGPRYNIAPTQDILVIRTVDGKRQYGPLRWGLIPAWSKEPKSPYLLINARSEEAATKPLFRSAMKTRRCLIPADGFYEWKKEGKQKLPFHFTLKTDEPFALAGLWERWEPKGEEESKVKAEDEAVEPVESCTILTTAANELVGTLHDRMPVMLSPTDYAAWMDPAITDSTNLSYLFEPFPVSEMAMKPANPIVNTARYDGPDCLAAG